MAAARRSSCDSSSSAKPALQVAGGLFDAFADGVWFVEFASLSDPSLVVQTVASVVGVAEEPGRSLLESLIAFAARLGREAFDQMWSAGRRLDAESAAEEALTMPVTELGPRP